MIDHDKNVGTVLEGDRRARHRRQHVRHVQHRQRPAHEHLAGRRHDPVPQREELELGRRLPRALHGPLAGQDQAGHASRTRSSRHHDWLPTLLAMAGDPDVKEKLLKGHKIGDMTYKVHLDGYNLVPYLTGQGRQEPARVVHLLQRRPAGDRPALRQLEARLHGTARAGHAARSGPSRSSPCASPRSSTCGPTPTSGPTSRRTPTTTGCSTTSSCSSRPRTTWASSSMTFKEFPQRQKAASFNLDEVMEKLKEGAGK